MKSTRPPLARTGLAALHRVLTLPGLIVLLSCQGVSDPAFPPDGNAGNPSTPVRTDARLALEVGPFVTVTNAYMEPTHTGGFLSIPTNVPVTFCWTAEPGTGGGQIAAYRYGWDVVTGGDWEVDFTPYDGSEVCAPPRTFPAPGPLLINFFTVEVMDDAGATTEVTVAVTVKYGPSSFDIMPGRCRNALSAQKKGDVRMAIPGRVGMGVSELDVSSIHLWIDGNTVTPAGTRVQDVTSAVINGEDCDCADGGKDGIDDLVLRFSARDVIAAMGPLAKGQTRELELRGSMLDGHEYRISDCVEIVGTSHTGDDPALLQRDAVIVALQNAYWARDYHTVDALLDDGFTFYFSESDYQSGKVPYAQWDREHELAATELLFEPEAAAAAGGEIIVRSAAFKPGAATEEVSWGEVKAAFLDGTYVGTTGVDFIPVYQQGEDNWITVIPSDPAYAGEVWYEKTATYLLLVYTGDLDLISLLSRQLLFVVRYSETKDAWQLVRCREF